MLALLCRLASLEPAAEVERSDEPVEFVEQLPYTAGGEGRGALTGRPHGTPSRDALASRCHQAQAEGENR